MVHDHSDIDDDEEGYDGDVGGPSECCGANIIGGFCVECHEHAEGEADEVVFKPATPEDQWLIEKLGNDGQPSELQENQDFAKDDDLNNISAEDIL